MKNISLISVAVALLIGFSVGSLVAYSPNNSESNHSEEMNDNHDSSSMSSAHSMFMVDVEKAPKVSLVVKEDEKSGWNVKVVTENFVFTPDKVNTENVVGEGHAHLYIDGKKVARLYGPDFHYAEDFDGTKTFRVTLNANDHSEYAVGEDVVDAEVQVTHNHNE